jgi:ergothioneine biosynthesis protein EgtB
MAPDELTRRFLAVRSRTEALAAPLSPEDQQLQSMPSCSPTKWHRAHTTWFFETFLLGPRGVPPVDARYGFLFNSYYEAIGPRHARPRRGLLSRPSCDEIAAYRATVDGRVAELLSGGVDAATQAIVELGLAHEEQHQELILTDALHALAENPIRPAYRGAVIDPPAPRNAAWRRFDGGLVEIGADAQGFAFDNERPRHKLWLEPFELADRCVTVGEVKQFRDDGGYRTPSLWLSDGWDAVQQHGWTAPAYWLDDGTIFGLDGVRVPDDDEPAAFLSYYEADAIARWMGARLPTEAEWERAAPPRLGTQIDDPRAAPLRPGDVWEWTASSYEAYPGYAPAADALGEYNGKFMVNQRVLRGGSCFTPVGHLRTTYRNFWHPDTRFQMTGLRIARR